MDKVKGAGQENNNSWRKMHEQKYGSRILRSMWMKNGCQEITQRNKQELTHGRPFVLFEKLGVHVLGNPLQKGFK